MKNTIATVFIVALIYGCGAFGSASLNIQEWESGFRGLCAFMICCVLVLAVNAMIAMHDDIFEQ